MYIYIITFRWIEKTDKNSIQERLQFATSGGAMPASQECQDTASSTVLEGQA